MLEQMIEQFLRSPIDSTKNAPHALSGMERERRGGEP
jgi:hypothetical protein